MEFKKHSTKIFKGPQKHGGVHGVQAGGPEDRSKTALLDISTQENIPSAPHLLQHLCRRGLCLGPQRGKAQRPRWATSAAWRGQALAGAPRRGCP